MDQNNIRIPDFYREQYEAFYQIYGEDEYQASGRALGVDDREINAIYQDVHKKLKLHRDDDVLDLGSGSGLLTMKMKRDVRHVHALDGSEAAIELLKGKLRDDDHVACTVGNIMERFPYKDGQFSKILCYSVVHLLGSQENVMKVIDESLRVLKSGGTILFGDLPLEKVAWENRIFRMFLTSLSALRQDDLYIFLKALENVLYCLDRKINRQNRSFSRKLKKVFTLLPLIIVRDLRSRLMDKNVMKSSRKGELKKKVNERIQQYNLYGFLYFDEIDALLKNYKDITCQLVSQSSSVSYPWERMDLVIYKK